MRKDLYRLMLAATAAVVGVFAYGCAEQPAVDQGGSLVSEDGTIAFTRVSGFGTSGLKKSDIYAIDVDASQEKRFTDSPGFDGFPALSPMGSVLPSRRVGMATGKSTSWIRMAHTSGA